MISVLMPTRGRAQMVKEAINSLGDVEVLLYVDSDDPELKKYKSLASPKVKVFIEPRLTYKNFHRMVNFLAKKAKGNWLLLFNDDMRIDGKLDVNYNSKLPMVLNFWDPANPRNNLAPIISRSMYETMGHFSLSTHCDSWVQDIANSLGFHVPVYGIPVSHLREGLNDETKQHTESVYPTSSPEYDSDDMLRLRMIDMEKLK